MGFRLKSIQFPDSMTADEYEKLLSDHGLIYEQTEHKKRRLEADIKKYKSRLVKVGYMSSDNVVCSYSVKEVTEDHNENDE
jgi:hypothetical protein